jgi:hypothetical protein
MVPSRERELLDLYADQGFTLEEPDDDLLILKQQGEIVGRFAQTGATAESIRNACAKHLANHTLEEKNDCR